MLLSLGVVGFDTVDCALEMRVTDLAEEIGTLDIETVALVVVCLGHGIQGFQDHDGRTRNHNIVLAEFLHRLGNHGLNVLDASPFISRERSSPIRLAISWAAPVSEE